MLDIRLRHDAGAPAECLEELLCPIADGGNQCARATAGNLIVKVNACAAGREREDTTKRLVCEEALNFLVSFEVGLLV